MAGIFQEGVFVYSLFNNGPDLKLGHSPTSSPHNGVHDDYVATLEDAVIPSFACGRTVASIGYRSLRELQNLKTVFIPKTITFIEADAFLGCPKLTQVTFQEKSQLETL